MGLFSGMQRMQRMQSPFSSGRLTGMYPEDRKRMRGMGLAGALAGLSDPSLHRPGMLGAMLAAAGSGMAGGREQARGQILGEKERKGEREQALERQSRLDQRQQEMDDLRRQTTEQQMRAAELQIEQAERLAKAQAGRVELKIKNGIHPDDPMGDEKLAQLMLTKQQQQLQDAQLKKAMAEAQAAELRLAGQHPDQLRAGAGAQLQRDVLTAGQEEDEERAQQKQITELMKMAEGISESLRDSQDSAKYRMDPEALSRDSMAIAAKQLGIASDYVQQEAADKAKQQWAGAANLGALMAPASPTAGMKTLGSKAAAAQQGEVVVGIETPPEEAFIGGRGDVKVNYLPESLGGPAQPFGRGGGHLGPGRASGGQRVTQPGRGESAELEQLAQSDPRKAQMIKEAKAAGYNDTEILEFLRGGGT